MRLRGSSQDDRSFVSMLTSASCFREECTLHKPHKTEIAEQMKLLAATLLFVTTAFAQRPAVPTAPAQPQAPPLKGSLAGHPAWPVAKPADVHSIDAILAALYDVISGPSGQQRDWDRMRS